METGMGRVIKGVFGKPCEECDEIIPAARLRVAPKTKLCVSCMDYREKRIERQIKLASKVARNNDTIIVRG
jgi:RNA polymerase-binding transcription factor DksA